MKRHAPLLIILGLVLVVLMGTPIAKSLAAAGFTGGFTGRFPLAGGIGAGGGGGGGCAGVIDASVGCPIPMLGS